MSKQLQNKLYNQPEQSEILEPFLMGYEAIQITINIMKQGQKVSFLTWF